MTNATYEGAFYELWQEMGIRAQDATPRREVWENQMLPRIREALDIVAKSKWQTMCVDGKAFASATDFFDYAIAIATRATKTSGLCDPRTSSRGTPAACPGCQARRLIAERTLRIVERHGGVQAIDELYDIVSQAGADYARAAIEHADVPF